MQQKPMISLIVTAYNRRKYIMEALNSVLGQTLENKFFEVIVIKNYADPAIDKFIEENGFKSIISEGIEGAFYNLGIEMSSGDIITFLDDDDIMAENRLETILKVFQDNKTGYYHNSFEAFKKGEIIKNRLIGSSKYKSFRITNKYIRYAFSLDRKQLYVNNSSISVRKEVLTPHLKALREQVTNIDRFLFTCALLSDFDLYFDDKVLTFYRIHTNQTGSLLSDDFKTLLNNKLRFIEKSINASINIMNISRNTIFYPYAKTRLINLELAYNFWSFEDKFKFKISDYLAYLKEKDYADIPLVLIYKTPKIIRRILIKFIYGV
jgi:glycosyltransferase involved in cell wall biosynthesis